MQIVRCPYCVIENDFKPMVISFEEARMLYRCKKCGHTVEPDDKDYRCHCRKCRESRNRVSQAS